jgi:hypothetical protein
MAKAAEALARQSGLPREKSSILTVVPALTLQILVEPCQHPMPGAATRSGCLRSLIDV